MRRSPGCVPTSTTRLLIPIRWPWTTNALDRLSGFVGDHRDRRLLNEHAHDLGETLVKVVTDFAGSAVPAANAAPLATVKQAHDVAKLINSLKDGLSDKESGAIDEALKRVDASVARWQRRQATFSPA